ncbi:MAG: hypothetical protein JXC36_08700 [Candidatus Atribacteria bacterium]|nr:hypothetical protein [Candidatus Atribacteria bacterium]
MTKFIILPGIWGAIFEIIGILIVFLTIIEQLSNLFPKLSRGKQFIFKKASQHFKFKTLEKQAISADIEGAINESVNILQDELPNGWIKKANIKWVKEQSLSDLEEGEVILRLKPQANQDSNLVHGIYCFFSSSLFPKTKEIIPESTQKAIAIQISKRTIENNRNYVLKSYESEIIEREIKITPAILDYLEDFDKLDKQGFFTSSFLREIDIVADNIRFSPHRNRFGEEINETINHTKRFIGALPDAPNELWARKGVVGSYRFLLVKNPRKFAYKIYVNRAKMGFDDNIDHFYIMGSKREEKFVNKVISRIQKEIPSYKLKEVYRLYKDFRGKDDGIGALFILDKSQP